ncbi:MAG: 2TM domain-containing protein [Patulibacter sp.]
MTDDPFARAAARVESTDRERRERRTATAHTIAGSWVNTGFRIHASVFLAVNLLLLATWLLTGGGYPWFVFPFLAWGIGLVAHYAAVERWIQRR